VDVNNAFNASKCLAIDTAHGTKDQVLGLDASKATVRTADGLRHRPIQITRVRMSDDTPQDANLGLRVARPLYLPHGHLLHGWWMASLWMAHGAHVAPTLEWANMESNNSTRCRCHSGSSLLPPRMSFGEARGLQATKQCEDAPRATGGMQRGASCGSWGRRDSWGPCHSGLWTLDSTPPIGTETRVRRQVIVSAETRYRAEWSAFESHVELDRN
jgi:hypothetical protein